MAIKSVSHWRSVNEDLRINFQNPIVYNVDVFRKMPVKTKILPELKLCEVGLKCDNVDCNGTAYRKVYTKYGHGYTCDCCARFIASENQEVWNNTK
jgi:hypothetical protein